jgi:hypothetical protein
MRDLQTVTESVADLLTEIDERDDLFLGLEDKKQTPALIAYQAASNMRMCDCLDALNGNLDKLNGLLTTITKRSGTLFQSDLEAGDGI